MHKRLCGYFLVCACVRACVYQVLVCVDVFVLVCVSSVVLAVVSIPIRMQLGVGTRTKDKSSLMSATSLTLKMEKVCMSPFPLPPHA